MRVILTHPKATLDHMGLIPFFLNEHDPRPAVEQFSEAYIAGWNDMKDFTLKKGVNPYDAYKLTFAGDPDLPEIGRVQLRDETIVLFDCSWVAVIQKDGSFTVSRMD